MSFLGRKLLALPFSICTSLISLRCLCFSLCPISHFPVFVFSALASICLTLGSFPPYLCVCGALLLCPPFPEMNWLPFISFPVFSHPIFWKEQIASLKPLTDCLVPFSPALGDEHPWSAIIFFSHSSYHVILWLAPKMVPSDCVHWRRVNFSEVSNPQKFLLGRT